MSSTSSPLSGINHIVVVMLENRSFDHMLGFLYADAGNKPLAIANCRKSVELNPKNVGGLKMLQKLGGQ